jgi:uncharacterized membrane protein
MQIYVHRNNQQLGPFTEAEIKAQLASGAISPQDHVWWEGQSGWAPLGQTPLAATGSPTSAAPAPIVPGALPGTTPGAAAPETSKLAIWALVCGCLSLLCSLFASIPAIILGHMGLSEIKKNPAIQGRGMAMAGMILGYVFTTLIIVYLVFVVVIFLTVGKGAFSTIESQIAQAQAAAQAAQAAQATNSADQSATNSDQTTNAPDQTTPAPAATNSPDQSTNSAPAAANSPDQSTNSAPAATNSPDQPTNSATPSTNAPDTSTKAAPMSP